MFNFGFGMAVLVFAAGAWLGLWVNRRMPPRLRCCQCRRWYKFGSPGMHDLKGLAFLCDKCVGKDNNDGRNN